jgi:hypothetical protein
VHSGLGEIALPLTSVEAEVEGMEKLGRGVKGKNEENN